MLRHVTSTSKSRKTGSKSLSIRSRGGNLEVKRALERFAAWVVDHHEFPIPVSAYLYPGHFIITVDGHRVASSFFVPDDSDESPYIRIATGDYPSLKKEVGRDNALAAYINSLSHQIVNYQHWIQTDDFEDEKVVAKKAVRFLRRYEKTVDRP